MADSVTPQDLKELMCGDRKPAIFDVRRKADFDAAPKKIGTATWRDPEKADEWISEVPQDRPVVFYCVKGGAVSQSMADRLKESNGEVRFLQGGIMAWAEAGEPVEE
jgi:rhodanese-related sulfurtransferase